MPTPGLLFHNKFQSIIGGTIFSEVGQNCYTGGSNPSFEPVKFDNGVKILTANERVRISNSDLFFPKTKGCIEFWFMPNFDLLAGQIPSDGLPYRYFVDSEYYEALIAFMHFSIDGMWVYLSTFNFGIPCPLWSAGDKIHLAVSWDTAGGIPGGKCAVIYFNGVEIASKVGTFTPTVFEQDITFGARSYDGLNPVNGAFDNAKIWDYAKTDFSDRDWEGDGIPINVTASKGSYSDKIRIYSDAVKGDTVQYRFYRSLSFDGAYSPVSDWTISNVFDDTTATPGITYFYKMKSKTALAESAYSDYDYGFRLSGAKLAINKFNRIGGIGI